MVEYYSNRLFVLIQYLVKLDTFEHRFVEQVTAKPKSEYDFK